MFYWRVCSMWIGNTDHFVIKRFYTLLPAYANLIIFILKRRHIRCLWHGLLSCYFMLLEYWVVQSEHVCCINSNKQYALPCKGSWSYAIYDSYAWKCIESKTCKSSDFFYFLRSIQNSCICFNAFQVWLFLIKPSIPKNFPKHFNCKWNKGTYFIGN